MNEPLIMLTVNEVAQKYGVAVWAVRQWTKPGGGLPCVRTGRKILIATQNIERFLIAGNNHPPQETPQPGKIRKIF